MLQGFLYTEIFPRLLMAILYFFLQILTEIRIQVFFCNSVRHSSRYFFKKFSSGISRNVSMDLSSNCYNIEGFLQNFFFPKILKGFIKYFTGEIIINPQRRLAWHNYEVKFVFFKLQLPWDLYISYKFINDFEERIYKK